MATPTQVVPNTVLLKHLGAETYKNWKVCMMAYMEAQELWDDVMDATNAPDEQTYRNKEWRKKNGAALLAIKTSCAPEILSKIRDERSAKVAWDTLEAQMKQQQQQQQLLLHTQPQQLPAENNNSSLSQSHQEALQFPDVPRLSMDPTALPQYHIPINYQDWSIKMRTYMIDRDVWYRIVELVFSANNYEPNNNGNDQSISIGGHYNPPTDLMDYKTWRDKNAMGLRAIQDACAPNIPPQIVGVTSAKIAWETLAKLDQLKQRGFPPNDPLYGNPLSEINVGYIPETTNPPTSIYQPSMGLSILCYKPKDLGPLVAIQKGDWGAIIGFIEHDRSILTTIISPDGSTLIHEAAATHRTEIAWRLVQKMSEQDLEKQSSIGNTPLHSAAAIGSTAIASLLAQKNKKLVQIPNIQGAIPLVLAGASGKKGTTRYLYDCTPIELLYPESGNHGLGLLQYCITNGILDIALDLLRKCPRLCLIGPTSPMISLACTPSAFYSGCRLGLWKRWIYSCIHIQRQVAQIHPPGVQIFQNSPTDGWNRLPKGIMQIYEMKLKHIYAAECVRCICEEIPTTDLSQSSDQKLFTTLVSAVANGIKEIVIEILKARPDSIIAMDSEGRDLRMLAIAFRQEKIFNLTLKGRLRFTKVNTADYNGNNILHWAGMPPPPAQLARIPGAALQMQRELQWFKTVESIVDPTFCEARNKEGSTPRQVFTETHKQLRDDGEKWMKETASSCTVVGALIITIMFAAAFTVPGGNFQDSNSIGFPIFGRKKAFITFIVSDAIALFSSSTSVLMFLGILTSRYAEEDFRISLPRKLIIGLSTLFVSIAAMMVAFCATIIIMLHGRLSVIIPVCLLAGIPISLFVILQFPLLVEIFNSTYIGIFSREKKAKIE